MFQQRFDVEVSSSTRCHANYIEQCQLFRVEKPDDGHCWPKHVVFWLLRI